MPQKPKNKNQKWLFLVLLVVLFVAVGGVTFLVVETFFGNKEDAEAGEIINVSDEEVIERVEEEIEGDKISEEEEVVEEPPSKVTQYEGENPNQLGELTGSISYAGLDPTGENLVVMTSIDQFLSGGTCELVVKRSGQVLASYSSRIVPEVSTSACEDRFTIPVSSIGHGETEIIINLSSGGKTGTLVGETKI